MIAAGRSSANVSAAATPPRKSTSRRNRRALVLGIGRGLRILDGDGDPELVELGLLDRGRRAGHRVDAGLVLRERDACRG